MTMQKLFIGLLTVLALLGLPTWSQAQADIVTTTITEAVTSTSDRTLTLSSATGVSAGIWILVDNELYRVAASYVSGTAVPVLRGPRPTTHRDDSRVWIFPIGAIVERAPQGSCTRGQNEAAYTLTVIRPTGALAACRTLGAVSGGVAGTGWVITDISGANGVLSDNPPETR